MNKSFLIIVEGKVFEKELFNNIFLRYGYEVRVIDESIRIPINDDYIEFLTTELNSEKNNVIIAQGPKTKIDDFVKLFNNQTMDFSRFFNKCPDYFGGVFLIYDVDHNSNESVNSMFDKFNDESTGLLLLSSPCIEVLGDCDHQEENKELIVSSLKKYKAVLNNKYNLSNSRYANIFDYIVNNFENCVLYFLNKNTIDFNNKNVLEHPELVKDKINSSNIRKTTIDDKECSIFRYFTTVLYVSIAYIKGLTKEIDNYEIVKKFFESKIN